MKMNDLAGRSLRFVRRWQAAGWAEAKRRIREEKEDGRIRRELGRPDFLTERERKAQAEEAFPPGIRFAVCFPDGTEPEEGTLRSLEEQTFTRWERTKDPAAAGPGAYAVFPEPDGRLHPGALHAFARAIRDGGADLIYTDEDYYLERPKDLSAPRFKPDYGPDSLRGCNEMDSLLACRVSLLREAGAEDFACLDGDARWDAVLKMAEKAERVCHIPRILYYRRVPSADAVPVPALRRIREEIKGEPLVSVLIPNKDHREDLKRCVDSIREKTTWPRYEIIILENNSTEPETFAYYRELRKDPRIRVVTREGAFNFSAVNNLGAREAKGEQLLLLNNDTEVISPDWMQEMLMYAQREDVGAVGAKLYFPDGTIQHGGIGIGIKIAAGHYHRGMPGEGDGYFGRLRFAQDVSAVTGACMMIPRRVYEGMRGMDETFSVVFNDIDLCLRMREAGLKIIWTPWAELVHYESKSRGADEATKEKKAFFVRETNRFLRKWHRALEAGDPYYNPNLTREREDFSPRG